MRTKEQAVRFVDAVGFCLTSTDDDGLLPSLWIAASGHRNSLPHRSTQTSIPRSFISEMKRVLPAEGRVFYGHLFRRRPMMISTELFPFFYALSERTGRRDDFMNEYRRGRLSGRSKAIMEALKDSAPQMTLGLRIAVNSQSQSQKREFEKAMWELQTKLYIVKTSGQRDSSTLEWNTVDKVFPSLVKKALRIRPEQAREAILQKYFENQLVASTQTIHRIFGWKKQTIYETLGRLITNGIITNGIMVDGDDGKFYCLIH